jgi:hypothetical protein
MDPSGDLNFNIKMSDQPPPQNYGSTQENKYPAFTGQAPTHQSPTTVQGGYGGQQQPGLTEIKIDAGVPDQQAQAQQQPSKIPFCGCLSLDYYRPYFNITTNDVQERLKLSLNPLKPTFFELTRDNPDLYGPFWTYTTIIFMLAAAGNLSRFIQTTSGFVPAYEFIPVAAALIYGFGLGVPIIFTFLLKFYGSNVHYINTICIYGYSMVVFIPLFLVCVVPSGLVQWICIIAGCAASAMFLLTNFAHEVNKYQGNTRYLLLGFVGVTQFVLLCVFKFYFFNQVYDTTVAPTSVTP